MRRNVPGWLDGGLLTCGLAVAALSNKDPLLFIVDIIFANNKNIFKAD
jgi:hypothetical protein